MSSLMDTLITSGQEGPVILLDHADFARQAFGNGQIDSPVGLMAVLSQANQLLQPQGHWVSLLDLVQSGAPGQAILTSGDGSPLAVLRKLFEDPEVEATTGRLLDSVRSAAGHAVARVLHLSSPADWIAATGETPDAEIDDLDAEDIAVFQTNLLQRLDLEGFGAISLDCGHSIAGDLAAACEPLVNYCNHQGLDFTLTGVNGVAQDWATFQFPAHNWINTDPKSGVLFLKVPEGCSPEFALLRVNTIREAA